MSMTDELKEYGVNVSEALERFMGNTAFYETTLKKFPASAEAHKVKEYIKSGDIQTAAANAHNLKGTTGNLSLTPLYEAYAEIVRLLRADNGEQALEELEKILPLQEKIIDCINGST